LNDFEKITKEKKEIESKLNDIQLEFEKKNLESKGFQMKLEQKESELNELKASNAKGDSESAKLVNELQKVNSIQTNEINQLSKYC